MTIRPRRDDPGGALRGDATLATLIGREKPLSDE